MVDCVEERNQRYLEGKKENYLYLTAYMVNSLSQLAFWYQMNMCQK